MAQLVYIDETGSVGRGAARQNQLIVVGIMVDESAVQPLDSALRQVARDHLGWFPFDLEFHGVDIWQGRGHWSSLDPPGLLAAYEAAISLIEQFEVSIAHATINKAELHARYNGAADVNAYRLALQFLLEKIDANMGGGLKILVADESKEEQLRAMKMVAEMQQWGGGEVPGRQLRTIIDSLHFVRSDASSGVQMADLVAYIIQRRRRGPEPHPDAQAARDRMNDTIQNHVRTWRTPWPS
jgi:hypothetical protein